VRQALRRAARLWKVITVLSGAFVVPALPFVRRPAGSGPVRMRSAFERLGGAWIKLGQMLAMRFDLLPAEYCDELFKLLNAVGAFPYSEASAIVQQELGAAPEVIFRSFEPQPFASASIGQVHRARLLTGEAVAVKVQRPGIRETMQTDIDLMYAVTRLLDWARVFGATPSREVIDEFARWTKDELDYLVEARQAVISYEHAKDEPLERVPRVYRHYTTSRVLTSELLTGIPLIDIVTALRSGDQTYLRQLEARGYSLETIVRHLDWNMLNQVYVFGYFHADLHPANMYILPGNAIGYVDFGMVGELPDNVRESLTRYSWLLFQWDVESAVRELMRWLAPSPTTNAAEARRQLIREHEAFLFEIGALQEGGSVSTAPTPALPNGRDPDNPYSRLAVDILQTVRSNNLSLSPSIVAYLRMLMMLGTLRHQLVANYDLPEVARSFFGGLIRLQAESLLDPRLALRRAYGLAYKVERAIEFVEFFEEQQPVIAQLIGVYTGVSARLATLKRRAIGVGLAILVVGAMLYFVLIDPDDARNITPSFLSFDLVHIMLLGLLILLTLVLIDLMRRMTSRG
jgi:predicted unusual protein kinase regulating ubiquinone biosynthesis (AarF/ABC1/UbiB family)